MKRLLASLLAALSFTAQAQTVVTLTSQYCGSMPACNNVASDTDDSINLAFSYLAGNGVKAIINGVVWDSGPMTGTGLDFSAGVYLYDGAGGVATFTGMFSHSARQINSGRAHYYRQSWGLASGVIALP